MTLPGNIDGFVAWGGNPPCVQPSADGAFFWSRNDKGNGGSGPIYYSVYREYQGNYTAVFRSLANAGQGTMQLGSDNKLYLSAYFGIGDGQMGVYAEIKEYVPFTQSNTAQLPERYVNALDRLCQWLGIP